MREKLTFGLFSLGSLGVFGCGDATAPGGSASATTGGSATVPSGGSSGTATAGSPGVATGGSIGATTGGLTGAGGGGDVVTLPTGTAGTSGIQDEEACGTGEASGELKDVSMLIMYDRSWSMTQCANPAATPQGFGGSLACTDGGPSRWDLTSQALTLFFQDPTAAQLGVGLRFFPDDAAGCTGFQDDTMPNCDATVCAQPLVDVGVLTPDPAPTDAQEAALVAAVGASVPPGPLMPTPNPATPIYAALDGALQWAGARQMASVNAQTVVVLVTDGEPVGCDTNVGNIAQLAGDAYTQYGVLTYVVGLTGSSEQQLNQIASAGGTMQGFYVADGGTATQDLLNTLLAIRGMALACDFPVPTATSSGAPVDPHLVNVDYTSSAGTLVKLGLVDSAAECGTQSAWYYDDPTNPTRIFLCPSTCTTITGDPHATIKILAGCEPRPPE